MKIFFQYLTIISLCLLFYGCVSISTEPYSKSQKHISQYKRVYIKMPAYNIYDEWDLKQVLVYELTDMGFEVISQPAENINEDDMLVEYSFKNGASRVKYLSAFRFKFIDASTGEIITFVTYKADSVWYGIRDGRLEDAFNDLRKQNGYPPTRQFQ